MTLKLTRTYRVASFISRKNVRYIFQHIKTKQLSIAISFYEVFLTYRMGSPNSVKDLLDRLIYLFSWAEQENIDLDDLLLTGTAPKPAQIRSFTYWLSRFITTTGKKKGRISLSTYNKIIDAASCIFVFFIRQYGCFNISGNKQYVSRERIVEYVKSQFKESKKKDRRKVFAGDLTEEEIATIEHFLHPDNRIDVKRSIAVRDYLIWRLAIEFGLRSGEILALRLCDCPRNKQQYIKIVRINEREEDYVDPRGAYAPRPKTLSRDLGFILVDSPIPRLISDYVSAYRCRTVTKSGRMIQQPILDHEFLIIAHKQKSALPLSMSMMQGIAATIRANTGIDFHWHLARHAFFNRAYSSLADHPNYKDRLMDLVTWGGWSSENSLHLYVNRARRERAQTALIFWQSGGNQWPALQ